MGLVYRKANASDIDILIKTRIEVLRAACLLNDDEDMSLVEKESYQYYMECFDKDEHVAYLIFDEDKFAGAGAISFYKVMPTYDNPTGKKAYVMNMYTHPDYRRRGIAYKTLGLLVEEARKRGVNHICLEATEMGKHVYLKYGFEWKTDEMKLPE